MKPTQEQVIAWAREVGFVEGTISFAADKYDIERFAALAYEAGQESMKWDGIHSCHPYCQRPACVHTRKTYQEGYEAGRKDENEACVDVAKLVAREIDDTNGTATYIAEAIRARREQ